MLHGHQEARMLSGWLVYRFVKFVGVALFGAGLVGAVLPARQRERLVAAHWVAPAGLLLTWLAGYGMMKATGISMREPWITASLGASLVALAGAVGAAARAGAAPFAGAVAAAGFVAAVGAMVGRGGGAALPVLAGAVPVVVGALAFALGTRLREHHGDAAHARAATLGWFAWVARLEGASLLFMLGVSMPLRKLAGISIDGGQGWVGWVHGVLTLLYIVALASAARAAGWSAGRAALGFVASMVPFGTFLFERRTLGSEVRNATTGG